MNSGINFNRSPFQCQGTTPTGPTTVGPTGPQGPRGLQGVDVNH